MLTFHRYIVTLFDDLTMLTHINYFECNGRLTVTNEEESKEAVLKDLRTASIHLEGTKKAANVLIQNPIFGRAKCEAENLTAQLLLSVKSTFFHLLCLYM